MNPSEEEKKILDFWKKKEIFKKSVEQKSQKKFYSFYDGPPFITGVPHHGSLLSSIVKDAIPRYFTMRGFRVERRWGWDCHGLPAENMVEKKLGLKSKKEIVEVVGVEKFNDACLAETSKVASGWEDIIERIGRWVEFKNAYKTMDLSYMESVWWAFKELHKKGLVYEDVRISLYCPRCSTPLSNFEIAMDNSYEEDTDPSVFVKMKSREEKDTSFLVWTTTPWTLPANVALAAGKEIKYVKVKLDGEYLWLAKERLALLEGEKYEIAEEVSGKDLEGKKYLPLFENEAAKDAYQIVLGDFVSTDEGAGLVHLAPAFGEDDFEIRKKENLPIILNVDEEGRFTEGLWQGQKVWEANGAVVEWLEKNGFIFKQEEVTHSYPHCHRCHTKLIYKAQPAWFIDIQKLKPKLLKANEKINWYPEFLKEGRFKKGLESAPDWNISRDRYWGTPMPVWRCEDCGQVEVVGSLEDLDEKAVKSGNRFWLMRHGQAENNVKKIINGDINHNHIRLTEEGVKQAELSARQLIGEKIDLIFASDFLRTRQTAEIVAEAIGYPKEKIIFEEGIREMRLGELEGCPEENFQCFGTCDEKFDKSPKGGETLAEIKRRVSGFLHEIDKKYQGKNILIVSHETPLWLMFSGAKKLDRRKTVMLREGPEYFFKNAEIKEVGISNVPYNMNYEADLHLPRVDQVQLICTKCGQPAKRIPQVFDCWVESGSMPFAQFHYPFENREKFEKSFPADFVSEYIAQTRAWFYVMHVLGVAIFDQAPFKNVVATGVIAGSDGRKMSKSLGNYTDPWEILNTYSADALRFYLLSSPLLNAQNVNFSEEAVRDISRGFLATIRNSHSFFKMYAPENFVAKKIKSENLLDRWIVSRQNRLALEINAAMEKYDLVKTSRLLEVFVDEFSNWYIRRSRERLQKPKDAAEKNEALQTLHSVLLTLAKLIAPLTPFLAEQLYLELKGKKDEESVHLCDYPQGEKKLVNQKLEEEMDLARRVTAEALAKRAEAGIKIRQPLAGLTIKEKIKQEFLDLIAQEVNVKTVKTGERFKLDTEITEELKREGRIREIERFYAQLRKDLGMVPGEVAAVLALSDPSLAEEEGPAYWRAQKLEAFKDDQKYDGVKEMKIEASVFKIGVVKR